MTSETNTLRKYVEKFYNEVEGLNEETINEVAETQCIGSLTIARPIPICCKDGITHKHQQGQSASGLWNITHYDHAYATS